MPCDDGVDGVERKNGTTHHGTAFIRAVGDISEGGSGIVAKAFRNTRKGIPGFLEPGERDLVRKLFNDIITMLEPDTAGDQDPLAAMVGLDDTAETPSDPALFRLLPNAVNNDDDEAESPAPKKTKAAAPLKKASGSASAGGEASKAGSNASAAASSAAPGPLRKKGIAQPKIDPAEATRLAKRRAADKRRREEKKGVPRLW